jgi:hypothetical protein
VNWKGFLEIFMILLSAVLNKHLESLNILNFKQFIFSYSMPISYNLVYLPSADLIMHLRVFKRMTKDALY